MGKTVMISDDLWRAIRDYLADIEGVTTGEFLESAVMVALDHTEELDEELGLEDEEEGEEEEEEEEEK